MYSLQLLDLATEAIVESSPTLLRGGKLAKASGMHKLLQRVVFYLSSHPGSVVVLPNIGSARVSELNHISLSETARAEAVVAGIQADLLQELESIPSGLPADERIGSLSLSIVSIDESSITIDVDIESAAGSSANYAYSLITG